MLIDRIGPAKIIDEKDVNHLRKENKGIRYFGFNEFAREVFGLPAPASTIRNEEKRTSLKAKFEEKNVCSHCKRPFTYIGGNILCCTNPKCNSKRGYKLLDERTKYLARGIYGESGVAV